MTRLLFLIPLCATALTAQVVTAPPAPRAPLAPTPPMAAPAPMAPFQVYTSNSDLRYDVDLLNEARSNLALSYNTISRFNQSFGGDELLGRGPVAWDQQDPADSLYRDAISQLNHGDYRKAADLFKALPQKYPGSAYVSDAGYWQAFALYRIGGTPELREALAVLEARKPAPDDTPDRSARNVARANSNRGSSVGVGSSSGGVGSGSGTAVSPAWTSVSTNTIWSRRTQTDAPALAARIAGVLAGRGMADDAAVKRALAAGGNSCDQEDQSVRTDALNALMQNDPATGRQLAGKILARRDDCSVPLRQDAVMLLARTHDDAATTALIPVAKSDPSPSVRMAAIQYLASMPGDAAMTAVIDLAHSSDDAQVQRMALGALASSSNPRARAEVRSVIDNNGTSEALRLSALDGFDRDKMTADDATWLRALYTRTTSDRVKERIISTISRVGGEANNQWLLALVRNEDEPLDSRTAALQRAGRTMDAATLIKMYDASSQRPIRETVIQLLSQRSEPEALDKLADIAKNGTDPAMRREAIGVLSRSKDPKAAQLLLQLVDRP